LPPAQILRRAALYALLFSLERSEHPRSKHFSLGHTQRVHFALALFLATEVIIETADSLQPYFDTLETLALEKVSVNVMSPHQFRTRNNLNKPKQTRSKSNENQVKSTSPIEILPLHSAGGGRRGKDHDRANRGTLRS
jgi:hypothetical protein